MKLQSTSEHARLTRRVWTNSVLAFVVMGLGVMAGCADSTNPSLNNGTAGSGGNGSGGNGSGGSVGGSGGMGGEGGSGGSNVSMPGPPEYVVKFNPAMGELAEGLAIDGTKAYVSFGSTFLITVDLASGTRADFGQIPGPIGVASPQGMTLDAAKNLYVAAMSSNPTDFKPGIYKFTPSGGMGTLFAENPEMSYPRHIFWVDGTEAIISVPPGSRLMSMTNTGMISQLGLGQTFGGDQGSACAWGEGIPYGVTSVVVDSTNTLYGTNADRATVFDGDGNIIAGPDCAMLGGAESIVIDPFDKGTSGNATTMYVAARRANKIVRIRVGTMIEVSVVSESSDLHEPSAIAMGVLGSDRYLFIVNSARTTYATGGVPGLLKMRLGPAN